ncbi:hypothetical protein BDQ17DRAFT_1366858 [Cyathus striatus]|nr:hypothetical protein BDQ17DRAFT_1366858 [Cyathus striatus]
MSQQASLKPEIGRADITLKQSLQDEIITRKSGLPRLTKLADVPKTNGLVKPLFNRTFAATWKETSTVLYLFLDILKIEWTTIDVVSIRNSPVIWIGVHPGTLSPAMARSVAAVCEEDIVSMDDVEVCFRESRPCTFF